MLYLVMAIALMGGQTSAQAQLTIDLDISPSTLTDASDVSTITSFDKYQNAIIKFLEVIQSFIK